MYRLDRRKCPNTFSSRWTAMQWCTNLHNSWCCSALQRVLAKKGVHRYGKYWCTAEQHQIACSSVHSRAAPNSLQHDTLPFCSAQRVPISVHALFAQSSVQCRTTPASLQLGALQCTVTKKSMDTFYGPDGMIDFSSGFNSLNCQILY